MRSGEPEGIPVSPDSTFGVLKERNYRFYWIGLVFYVLGHRAEYNAVVLLASRRLLLL